MGRPAPTMWISWKLVQNCELYRAFLYICIYVTCRNKRCQPPQNKFSHNAALKLQTHVSREGVIRFSWNLWHCWWVHSASFYSLWYFLWFFFIRLLPCFNYKENHKNVRTECKMQKPKIFWAGSSRSQEVRKVGRRECPGQLPGFSHSTPPPSLH